TDPIPAYRLSAGSTLPGRGGLRTVWRPVLGPVLAGLDEHVVDLRSGGYAALAPAPGATTLDVVSEAADGSRTTISHANKSYKGHAARLLASTRRRPKDTGGVLAVLADAGLRVERVDATSLVLVVPR
ncbi:MAG: uncharacterized protein QOE59_3382, partial [Actinomycetota bacterium]|nr:uncharacterized protein [Actinomycetota bacterium]